MSFITEIRRRKVFQVAAVYAVMAWLVIQVVDVISEPLKLPDWLATVVIVLLGVGFPIALVFAWAFDLTPTGVVAETPAKPSEETRSLSGQSLTLTLQALVLLAVGFLVFDHLLFSGTETRQSNSAQVRRFALDLPWQDMTNWGDFHVRISRQGTHLAYPGSDDNRTTINLRPLNSLDAVTLVSSRADPWELGFSPDGEQLAYFRNDRHLQVVSIRGGAPKSVYVLPEGEDTRGLSWLGDSSIIIGGLGGLRKVSIDGESNDFIASDHKEDSHRSPHALPNGTHAFVTLVSPGEASRLVVMDLRSLEIIGQPQKIAGNVAAGPSVSDEGTLVYVAERVDGTAGLVWVDRNGVAIPLSAERRDYTHIDLSPDGRQALLDTGDDIFLYEIGRGTFSSITSDRPERSLFPSWHPNGEQATFMQGPKVYEKIIEGSPRREALIDAPVIPTSWSPDGQKLATFDDQSDIWIFDRELGYEPFLDGPFNQRTGRFSPDGSAFAYVSDEWGGEFQVYVTPYPGPGKRTPVSIDGGLSPIWSSDGSELFFRQGSKVMSAAVQLKPEIDVSTPVELFDGPYTVDLSGHQRYDVAPDGRFLMVENSEDFRVVVVEGIFQELNSLLPGN